VANLKGSDHERQIYDAMYRLEARGTGRTGEARNDALSHSHAIVEKREMALKDFSRYATEKGLEGKLNTLLTPQNITDFLRDRVDGLKASTAEGYISNFSSLLKGLEAKNIEIPQFDRVELFSGLKTALNARTDHKSFETGRYISENKAFEIINSIAERSSPIAQLQYEHGFRAGEAREIVNNPEKYLQGNTVEHVRGKGGQEYAPKEITDSLREKIENVSERVTRDQYYRDVSKVIGNNRAHDLRLSYTINKYSELREEGKNHSEALKETSEQVNHHREQMTEYYQARG
jgi:hypothetical protein